MRIDVRFTPSEVDPKGIVGKVAVVIDVVRATTTMVEALSNGARAIHPTVSIEEAIRLRDSLGRGEALLCGERKGVAVEGFDLGNSPAEYTAEKVKGKQLVMTTTNGTMALSAASAADRVVVCSLVNVGAVAQAVADADSLVVVCAGKEGGFALDDTVVAGHLLTAVMALQEEAPDLGDGARAAVELAKSFDPDPAFFRATAAGQALVDTGLGGDLDHVARRDLYDLVPELRDRTVQLDAPG